MTIEEQMKEYARKKKKQRDKERYEKARASVWLDESDKQALEAARQALCQIYERHGDVKRKYGMRERVGRIKTIIEKLDFLLKEDGDAC